MGLINNDIFIGIEIGGTKLQLVTGDSSASVRERLRYSIDALDGAAGIRKQLEEGLQPLLQTNAVKSIGVGFGGPVNWETGEIQLSNQIKGWGNFNLKAWLQELTGLPVAVDNDANTAALAEAKQGAGKTCKTVFYMTIGSGIGGGVIIDGHIYHGRMPGEVEVGHIRLDKSGVTLENRCSGWAVNKKVREQIERKPGSRLAKLAENGSPAEAYYLAPALQENDADARMIIDEIADDIAFALSHVVHLFNPEIIIIGGGLSLLKDHLRAPIIQRLPHYLMKALLPAPGIYIASLGEDVVPIGALELAKQVANIYNGVQNK